MNQRELYRKKIAGFNSGKPFSLDDFKVDKAEFNNLLVFLTGEIKNGCIGRFTKGIYYKKKNGQDPLPVPDANSIVEFLLKKDNGYITGESSYSGLFLSESFPSVYTYASKKIPKRFKINGQHFVRIKSYAPVNRDNTLFLQLLDAILNIETIPGREPKDVLQIISTHLIKFNAIEIKKIEILSYYYPARVRALLGAVMEQLQLTLSSQRIKESLNPLSRYKVNHPLNLKNFENFYIHETNHC